MGRYQRHAATLRNLKLRNSSKIRSRLVQIHRAHPHKQLCVKLFKSISSSSSYGLTRHPCVHKIVVLTPNIHDGSDAKPLRRAATPAIGSARYKWPRDVLPQLSISQTPTLTCTAHVAGSRSARRDAALNRPQSTVGSIDARKS
jgi:hypothetical protein